MGALLLPSRLRQQPQQTVRLDRNNPLTKGIVLAWAGTPSANRDASGGRVATVTGPPAQAAYAQGLGPLFTGAEYIDFPSFGPELASTTTGSVGWIQQPVGASSYHTPIQFWPNGAGMPFLIYESVSDSSYYFVAGTRGSNAANFSSQVGAMVNGQVDSFLLTANGTFASTTASDYMLFRNQKKFTSSSTQSFSGSSVTTTRIGAGAGSGDNYKGIIGYVVFWNRILSDSEALSFNANPWQIFEAPAQRLWLPSAGAGSNTLTGAASTQIDLSAAGGVTQAQVLLGSASAQATVASTAAAVQVQALAGASGVQINLSSVGAAVEADVLVGSTSTQATLSSAGAVTQGDLLIGASALQIVLSSTAGTTQTQVLSAAGATQVNVAGASSTSQVHNLAGSSSAQATAASTGIVAQGLLLVGASALQPGLSSAGAVIVLEGLIGAPSISGALSSAGTAVQAHNLAGASVTQATLSSTGIANTGAVITLSGAPSAQATVSSTISLTQVQQLLATISLGGSLSGTGRMVLAQTLLGAPSIQLNTSSPGTINPGVLQDVYLLLIAAENRTLLSATEDRVLDLPGENRILRPL
jgi:hypothetical protein